VELARGLTRDANMDNLLSRHWHHLPREEIETLLESDAEKGLDIFEVVHRQKNFGPNRLTLKKGKSSYGANTRTSRMILVLGNITDNLFVQ